MQEIKKLVNQLDKSALCEGEGASELVRNMLEKYVSDEVPTICNALEMRAESTDIAFSMLDKEANIQETITYKELYRKVSGIAYEISQYVKPEGRAILLFNPGIEFIVNILGCLYAGVVAVPLNVPSRRGLERFVNVSEDCSPGLILSSSSIRKRLYDSINQVSSTPIPEWKHLDLEHFSGRLEKTLARADSLAILQYTSGSTGKPKGVQISHENIIHNVSMIMLAMGFSADTKVLSWLPLFHDMGLFGCMISPLYCGLEIFYITPTDFFAAPRSWFDAVSKYNITITGAPNFAFDLCVEKDIQENMPDDMDLSSLRVIFCGAEPIKAETMKRFCERFERIGLDPDSLTPCYGLAEVTLLAACNTLSAGCKYLSVDKTLFSKGVIKEIEESDQSLLLVSSGKAVPGQALCIVDPESESLCADGQVGEIWISGSHVSAGYFSGGEDINAAFVAKDVSGDLREWVRTGDLGFIWEEELYISGRIKDVIIIRGANYYPSDIERIVENSHPALRLNSTAAFMLEGDELAVVCELGRNTKNIDGEAVFKAAREAIGRDLNLYLNHLRLVSFGQLKKTTSGKIQRRGNKTAYIDKSHKIFFDSVSDIKEPSIDVMDGPKNPKVHQPESHEELTDRLSELFGFSFTEHGDTPFSSLGITSIEAVEFASRLKDVAGLALPSTLLWDYATPKELHDYLCTRFDFNAAPVEQNLSSNTIQSSDEIAIIGSGLLLPGCNTLEDFWTVLQEGRLMVSEHKACDGSSHHYAKVDLPFDFDCERFGITPKEAIYMDPQQRWLLSSIVQAAEQAGYQMESLKGSDTGVYVGCASNDYGRLLYGLQDDSNAQTADEHAYMMTGNSMSICSNRPSYVFDFRGPSITIDTACSSSLVAIRQACEDLSNGSVDYAFAGGVNHIGDASLSQSLRKAGMLSPNNRSATFSQDADGYARGEGCVVFMLKRLDDAVRDGDPVMGRLCGWAVNQDGLTNGMTAPNGRSQAELYHKALKKSGLSPADINYIETHGTGTPLGDPIEVNSLIDVYDSETRNEPCILGSVKACFGHLEAGAGAIGLLKAVEVLRRQSIVAQPVFHSLNTHFSESRKMSVGRESHRLNSSESAAAVSSFGFGGTNAHLIVKRYQDQNNRQAEGEYVQKHTSPGWPVVIAADSKKSLVLHIKNLLAHLQQDDHGLQGDLSAISQTLTVKRDRKKYSLSGVFNSKKDVINWLEHVSVDDAEIISPRKTSPVFILPGQGSQKAGMGYYLNQRFTAFSQALSQVVGLIENSEYRQQIQACLLDKESTIINDTRYSQVALFCYQYALAKLVESFGIAPSMTCGHSVGEIAAAHLSGILSLKDAVKLISSRAQCMADHAEPSVMLVVFGKAALPPLPDGVELSVQNSPAQAVVAGSREAIDQYCTALTEAGLRFKPLNVSHGFHSKAVDPSLPVFKEALVAADIAFEAPQVSFVSSMLGGVKNDEFDVDYWLSQIRNPVFFDQACQVMINQGATDFIEIGSGELSALIKQNSRDVNVFCVKNTEDGMTEFLLSLMKQGIEIAWDELFEQESRPVLLPATPLDGKTYLHPLLENSNNDAFRKNANNDVSSEPKTEFRMSDSKQVDNIVELFNRQISVIEAVVKGNAVGHVDEIAADKDTVNPPVETRQLKKNINELQIDDTLSVLLADILGVSAHQIDFKKSFSHDLGMDSLMLMGLRDKMLNTYPALDVTKATELVMLPGQNLKNVSSSLNEILAAGVPVPAQAVKKPRMTSTVVNVKPVTRESEIHLFPEVVDLLDRVKEQGDNNPFFRSLHPEGGCLVSYRGENKINFSSYNYVGMANNEAVERAAHTAIETYGTSVSASRPISGERDIHARLEKTLAEFLGCEDAVAMLGGHATNETVIGHIVGQGDLILCDSLVHNSIVQGSLLSDARRRNFPHNDFAALDNILKEERSSARRVLIVIEGVYSMDGDIPDLPQLIELKKKHQCLLMVDEAHSIGTIGTGGRGIGAYYGVDRTDVDLWMGTFSKAFGSCGGYIAGQSALIQYLKYTTPGFVFSVGMPPASAAAANESIVQLMKNPSLVEDLNNKADYMRLLLRDAGIDIGDSLDTPVIPVIIGDSKACLALSTRMFESGINVNPIVYPAVDEAQARLRFFLTVHHSNDHIETAVLKLIEHMTDMGLINLDKQHQALSDQSAFEEATLPRVS